MSEFLNFDKSKAYIQESSQHLAGGVNSTFRTGMQPNALSLALLLEKEHILLI